MALCFRHASERGTPTQIPGDRRTHPPATCECRGCTGIGRWQGDREAMRADEADPAPRERNSLLQRISTVSDAYAPITWRRKVTP